MNRARHALGALRWGVLLVAALVWWAPSLLLALARWQGGRLRFEATMAAGRALVALGWPQAASWVYGAALRRTERELRAAEGRRGW